MYTKQNLIDAVSNEFRILKHLVEKIPADTEGYKPTEGQRTTLELVQYLSYVFSATTKVILANDSSLYMPLHEKSKETTIQNFASILDQEEIEFKKALENVTDEDLSVVINLYNQGEKTKGVYLVELMLKWLGAYKTQLFLYIKASGNTNLGTSNLWGGFDMPQTDSK
jgi:hypothetical protein